MPLGMKMSFCEGFRSCKRLRGKTFLSDLETEKLWFHPAANMLTDRVSCVLWNVCTFFS